MTAFFGPDPKEAGHGLFVREAQIFGRHLAVPAGLQLVGDFLAFGKSAQSRALDGRDMNERVLAAVFRLDEAEAFIDVEKFNGTGCHDLSFDSVDAPISALRHRARNERSQSQEKPFERPLRSLRSHETNVKRSFVYTIMPSIARFF